jgi:hypothetical protein
MWLNAISQIGMPNTVVPKSQLRKYACPTGRQSGRISQLHACFCLHAWQTRAMYERVANTIVCVVYGLVGHDSRGVCWGFMQLSQVAVQSASHMGCWLGVGLPKAHDGCVLSWGVVNGSVVVGLCLTGCVWLAPLKK